MAQRDHRPPWEQKRHLERAILAAAALGDSEEPAPERAVEPAPAAPVKKAAPKKAAPRKTAAKKTAAKKAAKKK